MCVHEVPFTVIGVHPVAVHALLLYDGAVGLEVPFANHSIKPVVPSSSEIEPRISFERRVVALFFSICIRVIIGRSLS